MKLVIIALTLLTSLASIASYNDLNNTTIDGTTYQASIVIKKYDTYSNLADFNDFFQDQKELCFNGDLETAYLVANKIENNIWIYDEYEMYSISKLSDSIEFKVFDSFSFYDQNADESEKDEYMFYYTARKCNF